MAIPKYITDAIKACRLYQGSMNCRIKDQQKLYNAMMRHVNKIAKMKNMDPSCVLEQLTDEAARQGSITPLAGKDL